MDNQGHQIHGLKMLICASTKFTSESPKTGDTNSSLLVEVKQTLTLFTYHLYTTQMVLTTLKARKYYSTLPSIKPKCFKQMTLKNPINGTKMG